MQSGSAPKPSFSICASARWASFVHATSRAPYMACATFCIFTGIDSAQS